MWIARRVRVVEARKQVAPRKKRESWRRERGEVMGVCSSAKGSAGGGGGGCGCGEGGESWREGAVGCEEGGWRERERKMGSFWRVSIVRFCSRRKGL